MRWTVGTLGSLERLGRLGRRVVVLGLLAALLGIAAPQAGAAPAAAPKPALTLASVAWHQTDGPQYQGERHTAASPDPGPSINQKAKDAEAAQNQRKLILGLVCIGLLVLVWFGRRGRRKHRRRLRNLQNAKA